jgi:hypothetical protein
MGTRSHQLWRLSQLLELEQQIESIPALRARYPQIAAKYSKLGDDQLEAVIRRVGEAKGRGLDPLTYYPPVAIPKKNSKNADRDAEIIAAVRAFPRESYAAIGKRFGISRERVRQIVGKFKEKNGVQSNRTKRSPQAFRSRP